jgi:uncharacterized membrane protein YhaH (DUF805 family)
MNPLEAVLTALRRSLDFSGRSRRSEYWWTIALAGLLSVAGDALPKDARDPYGIALAAMAFVPLLAVSVRRLHDVDRSGWSLLVGLIPLLGSIVLLFWDISPGTTGRNRFGPSVIPEDVARAALHLPPAPSHKVRRYLDADGREIRREEC